MGWGWSWHWGGCVVASVLDVLSGRPRQRWLYLDVCMYSVFTSSTVYMYMYVSGLSLCTTVHQASTRLRPEGTSALPPPLSFILLQYTWRDRTRRPIQYAIARRPLGGAPASTRLVSHPRHSPTSTHSYHTRSVHASSSSMIPTAESVYPHPKRRACCCQPWNVSDVSAP